ncbi:MAG TPA: rhamnulokinase family protein [Candidatus Solibacter sp.]|nr:rhamnulokinase family protein [Candidatus Solibacter sp.]
MRRRLGSTPARAATPPDGTDRLSTHLAVDLGAESARAFIGEVGGAGLRMTEVGRQSHRPLLLADRVAWDATGIFDFIVRTLESVEGPLDSVSIDGWGVDFGLLREDGSLVGMPRSYRDHLFDGSDERLASRLRPAEVYRRTGIQFLQFNTLNQLLTLAEERPAELETARTLLLLPDLFRHWLGAPPAAERTNASTTQLLALDGTWSAELLAGAGLNPSLFPEVIDSLALTGECRVGRPGVPLVAGPSHDTAAAVAGTPFGGSRPAAFISSGTWSIVGIEAAAPSVTAEAMALNLSNEHGVGNTTRLLRNVMGLWLLQRCRHAWLDSDGHSPTYAELMSEAAAVPFGVSLIDPDNAAFLNPDDMPRAIADYCLATGQEPPLGRAEFTRCIYDSLALRYRWVLDAITGVSGVLPEIINIVGGGSANPLLCQATADASGLPVVAGPSEAAVTGNVLVQAVTVGTLSNLQAGRHLLEQSHGLAHYEPSGDPRWNILWNRFLELPGVGSPWPDRSPASGSSRI